jgi:pimeloyl-ACP methyl ester carboxylesterase
MLPGNMCDARMWDGTFPDGEGIDIAAPVPPGATITAMAHWCLRTFEGPLIPIGFSMGGIVALAMAEKAPDRIAAIGLLSTNPGADRPERAAARPAQQAEAMERGLERLVAEELKPNYLAEGNKDDSALRKRILDMALGLGPQVFARQSEALRTRTSYEHVLGRLTCPAIVMCGAEDRLCPPDLHRRIAERLAQPTLHIVEDAGHMLPMEQPGLVRRHLTHWLQTIRTPLP